MATAFTYDEIKGNSQTIQGILNLISARKKKIRGFVLSKFLLFYFAKFKRETDLNAINRETAEKIFPVLKRLHLISQETFPFLLSAEASFISRKDKEKLSHYMEYLEDIVESLEIGLDPEVAAKIQDAAKGINPSDEIPPWREVIEQI